MARVAVLVHRVLRPGVALPAAVLMLLLPAAPAAATHEAPGGVPPTPLPARPRSCSPAPSWVDATPDSTTTPTPGLQLRSWHGPGRDGVPMRVVAAEADTVRIGLSISVPPRFGAVLPTTQLTKRADALVGVNGDYFEPGAAGAVPRGVEVQDGAVLYGPSGDTKAVGVGEDGVLHAGHVRVGGTIIATVASTSQQLTIGSVNAGPPGKQGIAVQTAFGSAQSRKAGWYVKLHAGVAVSSSAADPGAPTGGDVLLLASAAERAALARIRPGATVAVNPTVRGTDGVSLTDALGSSDPILTAGAIVVTCTGEYGTGWRPRTVVAWNNRRARMWLLTVNAVAGGESGSGVRGVTYGEAADLARRLGATDAVLLDGGHSTTLGVRGEHEVVRSDAPGSAAMRPVPDAVVLLPG